MNRCLTPATDDNRLSCRDRTGISVGLHTDATGGTTMFKIGFSTLGCPSYTVAEIADLARVNGYDGVEIRFVRGVVDLAALEEFSARRLAETKKIFDDAGVTVNCIDTSVRFTSNDPAERTAQRDLAKANCAIANGLGATFIRAFGGPVPCGQRSVRSRRQDRRRSGYGRRGHLGRGCTNPAGNPRRFQHFRQGQPDPRPKQPSARRALGLAAQLAARRARRADPCQARRPDPAGARQGLEHGHSRGLRPGVDRDGHRPAG
ncbi:TIM barrel protein [Microlunatus sp. Gsoil 973]|nr:TIM barrel protein [Microlunatus sp. Gsoil 973]